MEAAAAKVPKGWVRVRHPADPDWLEYHKQVMSPKHGRVRLKVYRNYQGQFMASFSTPMDMHASFSIKADDLNSALKMAEKSLSK